jgi:hypothetical protein
VEALLAAVAAAADNCGPLGAGEGLAIGPAGWSDGGFLVDDPWDDPTARPGGGGGVGAAPADSHSVDDPSLPGCGGVATNEQCGSFSASRQFSGYRAAVTEQSLQNCGYRAVWLPRK